MAEQAEFIIATLNSDGTTPSGDTLILGGRALPYQGFELEGTMRAEFTWYPGNAVATVQMIGAEEKQSTIKGQWKDKFLRGLTDDVVPQAVQPTAIALLNSQPLEDVQSLARAVDKMRLAGQLLKITWGSITRVGILLGFKQNWTRFEDMEWEMTFGWISRGEVQSPVVSKAPPSTLSFSKKINSFVDGIRAALEAASRPFQFIERFSNTVSAALEDIDDAALEIGNAVNNSTQLISVPQDAATRALAASESIKASAGTIISAISSVAPEELVKNTAGSAVTLGTKLQIISLTRGLTDAARELQMFASTTGDELRSSLDQDELLAVFVARAPLDLRDVAQRYYDSPNHWRDLLAYNQLETSALSVGQLVLVPKIFTADGRV